MAPFLETYSVFGIITRQVVRYVGSGKTETLTNVTMAIQNNLQTIRELLSIVLPIHKQSHHIRQVVKAYVAELTQIDHELIWW